jgi:hypothetical protein
MRTTLLLAGFGMFLFALVVPGLHADLVEMQNGDRYFGKVVSVSANTVVFSSEMLGKIQVPRQKVATLTFGNITAAPPATSHPAQSVPPSVPAMTATSPLAGTNVDLSAALRRLGSDTNFVAQIRQQMLAGSPEANAKYDEMVGGLLSGKLNLNDLRQEAQSSAKQLQELKQELGPDADEEFDGYLDVLNQFIQETAADPTVTGPKPKSSAP